MMGNTTSMLSTILAAANDVLLPGDVNKAIWKGLAFIIVVAFLYKVGKDPLSKSIKDKRGAIEVDLDAATELRQEAEAELAEVRTRLAGAADERDRILQEAKRTAAAVAEEHRERTTREVEEARSRALRDIEANKAQAMADLQAMVGDLTLGAAELVVRNSLDDDTQRQLVDRYINELSVN
jgi:F-type H+-transporting ATPase subunit b